MRTQPRDSQVIGVKVIGVRPYIFLNTKILIYRPVHRMQNLISLTGHTLAALHWKTEPRPSLSL